MIEGLRLLHLMQVSSASFPIGAFAYSQGMEGAIERGWVSDEASAVSWITGQVEHLQSHLELPLLARYYAAWQAQDLALVASWGEVQLAFRDARELRDEDAKLARSMLRALGALGVGLAQAYEGPLSWVGAFALAGVHFEVPLAETASGFLYAFCENQTIVASRLIPLGQQAAQRALSACLERVPAAVAHALSLPDDQLGFGSPAHSLACIGHETQYSRLFLS